MMTLYSVMCMYMIIKFCERMLYARAVHEAGINTRVLYDVRLDLDDLPNYTKRVKDILELARSRYSYSKILKW